MQMKLPCRDLSAGLRPTGIRVDFTAATGWVNMRCTNSNVHGKDWSSSNTSNCRHSSPCTQGASGGEPLYAHKNTKNTQPLHLGLEGALETGINLASLSVLQVG